MATVKKTIGKVPVGRGNYSNNTVYYKENTVTLLGMSFRALTDIAAGVAPAVVENNKAKLTNTDKWQLIAGAPEIYSATLQLNQNTERIANNANAIGALAQKTDQEYTALVNGDIIVGQAREVYSRQGKTDTATFLKRTTAGGTTISDGVASIKQIGGNIVKNLVDGVSITDWITKSDTDISLNNGIITIKSKRTDGKGCLGYKSFTSSSALVSGHKFYASCFIKSETMPNDLITVGQSNEDNTIRPSFSVRIGNNTSWQYISLCETLPMQTYYSMFAIGDKRTEGIGEIYIKNPLLVDLTEMYGAGNEPSKEECDRMFATMGALPQGLTVAQPTALKSVGYNQWNPANVMPGKCIADGAIVDNAGTSIAIIECLPCKTGAGENNGYVIGYGSGDAWSDSAVEVYLTPLNPMETEGELYLYRLEKDATYNTYLPGIAGYLLVVTPTTDQLCAHLHWSGDRTTTDYEPYNESTVQLPDIPQMSEWGLAGIAANGTMLQDVIDLENNRYVKRIARKKLISEISLRYRADVTSKNITSGSLSHNGAIISEGYTTIPPQKTAEDFGTYCDKNQIDKAIGVNKDGRYFYLKDTAFNEDEDAVATILNNKIIYYSEFPEEYPIVTKAAPNYIGSDYGVEQFSGSKVPLAANILFYMRSLVSETRNFLDRLMAGLGSDVTAVADKIIAAVNTVNAPAEEVGDEGEQTEE